MEDIEAIAKDVVDASIKGHRALGLVCLNRLTSNAMLLNFVSAAGKY